MTFDPKTLKKITIAGKAFLVSPVIFDRLSRANAAMLKATGKNIIIVFAYRSPELQQKLYKEMKAKNPLARVATPGKSFHERGQAIDVQNWNEAQPFLRKEGFLNPLPDDKVHFSVGEFLPGKIYAALKKKTPAAAGILIAGVIIFFLFTTLKKDGRQWPKRKGT